MTSLEFLKGDQSIRDVLECLSQDLVHFSVMIVDFSWKFVDY